jgi:hypothetical protein
MLTIPASMMVWRRCVSLSLSRLLVLPCLRRLHRWRVVVAVDEKSG